MSKSNANQVNDQKYVNLPPPPPPPIIPGYN